MKNNSDSKYFYNSHQKFYDIDINNHSNPLIFKQKNQSNFFGNKRNIYESSGQEKFQENTVLDIFLSSNREKNQYENSLPNFQTNIPTAITQENISEIQYIKEKFESFVNKTNGRLENIEKESKSNRKLFQLSDEILKLKKNENYEDVFSLKNYVEEKHFNEIVKKVMNIELKLNKFESEFLKFSEAVSYKFEEISEKFSDQLKLSQEYIHKNVIKSTYSKFEKEEKLIDTQEEKTEEKFKNFGDNINMKFSQIIDAIEDLGKKNKNIQNDFNQECFVIQKIESDMFKIIQNIKDINDNYNSLRIFIDEIDKLKIQVSNIFETLSKIIKIKEIDIL